MAPKDDEWKPELVRAPEKDPESRHFFDWKDKKLLEWKNHAIQMQEMHARDNNRTEWFAYKPEERDAMELRILMALYGIRIPKVLLSLFLKTKLIDLIHFRKVLSALLRVLSKRTHVKKGKMLEK